MTTEHEIREALEMEASAFEPAADLAQRTLAAAREADAPSLAQRIRARRDARSTRIAGVRGYPKWAYAGAAAAMIAVLFAAGTPFTRTPSQVAAPGARAVAPGAAQPLVATTNESSGSSAGSAGLPAGSGEKAPIAADQSLRDSTIAPMPPVPVPQTNPGTFPPQIAKTADLEVRVPKGRFDAQWSRAQGIAAKYAGFVTTSQTDMLRGKLARGTLTLRVPSDKLEAAIGDFRRLGTLVRQTTTGNDVSGQLVDYDARLRAMQAQEAQLLELMKSAKSLSDTLEIRSRLDQVRQEIESLQAQRSNLQGQVDYSTITATVYEPDAAPAEPKPVSSLGRAWDQSVRAALTIVAGLVVILGFVGPLALLALLAWGVVRLIRRRRAA